MASNEILRVGTVNAAMSTKYPESMHTDPVQSTSTNLFTYGTLRPEAKESCIILINFKHAKK